MRFLSPCDAPPCALWRPHSWRGLRANPHSVRPASSTQFTLFEAPRELLSADLEPTLADLDEIQSLGARAIRLNLYWNSVAPDNERQASRRRASTRRNPDSGYDWSVYDRAIGEATQRGMDVLVTITGPVPTWATRAEAGHTYKPSTHALRALRRRPPARYGNAGQHWSIWNEPNHPQFLTPQFVKRPRRTRPASTAASCAPRSRA